MSLSKMQMIVVIAVSLALMAGLDFVTGQELVFSCAYLLPVSLTAWWFSRRAAVITSILSGITALVVDEVDGYDYSTPGIEYWNAFTCFAIALITALVLSRLKESLQEREEANRELRDALAKLEASTVEIRKLQAGLQTVCAWTHKIKVGDQWMTPDEFLTTQLHLQLSHGMSPEACGEFFKHATAEAA